MSDENNGWNLASKSRAPDGELVLIWDNRHPKDGGGKPFGTYCANQLPHTHWRLAQLPAPPKPEQVEKTQQELDREAYLAFENRGAVLSLSPYIGQDRQAAWHAALAYRDAQNREDLANIGQYSSAFDTAAHVVALFNLRKRCGLP